MHLWIYDTNHSSYIQSTTFHISYIGHIYVMLNERHIDEVTVLAGQYYWCEEEPSQTTLAHQRFP